MVIMDFEATCFPSSADRYSGQKWFQEIIGKKFRISLQLFHTAERPLIFPLQFPPPQRSVRWSSICKVVASRTNFIRTCGQRHSRGCPPAVWISCTSRSAKWTAHRLSKMCFRHCRRGRRIMPIGTMSRCPTNRCCSAINVTWCTRHGRAPIWAFFCEMNASTSASPCHGKCSFGSMLKAFFRLVFIVADAFLFGAFFKQNPKCVFYVSVCSQSLYPGESTRLDSAMNYLGVQRCGSAHTAMGDAKTLAGLVLRMKEHGGQFNRLNRARD